MDDAPLSATQRRIWFAEQLDGTGSAYVLPFALRLHGPLRPAALESALRRCVAEHPALRTAFVPLPGGGVGQRVIDADRTPALRLRTTRAHGRTARARSADAHARARAHARRPFDLARAPLLRPALLRIDADDHLLALPVHHLVADGFSLGILHRDLVNHYGAVSGEPRSHGYFAFADDDAAAHDALAAVAESFRDAPPVHAPLPDHPRSPDSRGHDVRTRLDPETDAAVHRLAEEHGVSAFTVYCAVLHALLVRHDGQPDSVIGFMSANRLRPGSRSVIGPFASPLPHRVDCSDDPTVGELLARARTALHTAATHNELRIEDLVRTLGTPREPGRHPLFQVLLNEVSLPGPLRSADGLLCTPVLLDGGTSWLDLELTLLPSSETTELHLKAKARPFDRATAERLLDQFRTVLRAACANPALRLSEVPLLSRRQRNAVLAAGTGATVPDYAEGTLQELVRRGLIEGRAPAVITDDTEWSRSELVRRVTSVAAFLRGQGVGPESVVAVCAERSSALVVALLGTALAGGAFLPLDPDIPRARRERMLAGVDPTAVLVSRANRDGVGDDRPVHLIEDAVRTPPAPVEDFVAAAPAPEDTAYVLHTSGSSGTPKAVVNTQRGVHNRLLWMRDAYAIGRTDRLLQKTPVTFDVSVWEIFLPVVTGAALVLARPGGHRDAHYLASTLTRHGITVAHFVPTMLRVFLDSTDRIGDHRLRHVFCSGEELSPHLAQRAAAATSARVHNLYGPTEAAVDVTAHECTGSATAVPIGRAVPNTRVHVLDDRGALVPFDVVGELHLGGVQLARGYHGMPELTGRRFVPDPTGRGTRLYRTGDLGRMRPGGDIEFLGRRDRQVKLRGVRIEPGEVETALEALPGVRRALCRVARADGTDRLVAYVLPDDEVTEEGMRTALAEQLPAHLVPARYLVLADLPLLPNGKLDESGLATAVPAKQGRPPATPARTPAEDVLFPVVRRVLRRDDLGRADSFFSSGGDSLLAVRLVAEAAEAGLELTVEDVLRHPVLADLAAAARPGTTPSPSARPGAFFALTLAERAALGEDVVDGFPLGATLSGLVVESQRTTGYRAYVTSVLVDGQCPVGDLRRALTRVVARHPVLRSSLLLPEGTRPLHVVHRTVQAEPDVRDLRDRTPESAEREVDDWVREQEHHRFPWTEPPLFRVTAHLLPRNRFRLSLVEPMLDGWSATTVLTELLDAPEASGHDAAQSTVEQVQREFVRAELAALADDSARRFWRDRVRACPTTRLPFPRDDSAQLRVPVPLAAGVSDALLDIADRTGLPLKSVLLAAHVRVLSLLAGQRAVGTGVMAPARPGTRASTEAVGMFLNTAILSLDLPGGTWHQLADELRRAEATALGHRAFPYVEALRDADTAMPTDATFNYTHFQPYREIAASGDRTVLAVRANDQTYFPLTAQFRRDPRTGAVELVLELRTADPGWGHRIGALYRSALEHLAGGVEQRYDIDLVPGDPELFGSRSASPASAPSPTRFPHELFEQRVGEQPEETALVTDERTITRTQLAVEVARVRTRLRDLGIGTGDRVGVHLPRSPEQVAVLLAVLSEGAVYVPLDTALPEPRIAELRNSADCVAVCDSTGVHPGDRSPGGDRRALAPGSPAVLMFTSGSTGTPKGVLIPHSALSNRLSWGWRELPYRDGEVVLARTPIGFVDSLAEVLSPVLGGVPVALLDESRASPAELVDALSAVGATRVTLVPTLLAEILRLDIDPCGTLPRLRTWVLSGEPLPSALVRDLLDRMPHAVVHNLYGCTEVTADVTAYRATGREQEATVPIGRPIDGCAVTPLDPWGHPSVPGVPGALAVEGAAVATGYHRDGPGGFTPTAYRTGDLGVLTSDGLLHHLGRTDRQCKIRGVRLDPTEIEQVLRSDSAVLDAVVRQDHGELRACLRPVPGAEVRPRRLRETVRHRLSRTAVPARFAIADSWPRTATGKIDVRAVFRRARWIDEDRRRARPATLMERTLAERWEAHLGAGTVHREDDFFELGGQSLAAMVLAGDLRRTLGVPVGVQDLFDHPILAELATVLERRLVSAEGPTRTGRE